MLRQPHIRASRASLAENWPGLRVALLQKLFKGYIFCFPGDPFGQYIFELFARETNLKKKRSVRVTNVLLFLEVYRNSILYCVYT